jgi:hypothetical protein
MIEDDSDLERQCSIIVDRLISRYRWGLLGRDEFIKRTIAAAQGRLKIDVQLIAFGIYNQALHSACSGAEGSARWELAYTELFVILSDRAKARYPDVWEDAVQTAIESTCISFDRCIEPRAFSAFAWQYFLNAVRSLQPHLRRKDKQLPLSLERTIGEADEQIFAQVLLWDMVDNSALPFGSSTYLFSGGPSIGDASLRGHPTDPYSCQSPMEARWPPSFPPQATPVGWGGRGRSSRSRAVHRRLVRPAAIAGVR